MLFPRYVRLPSLAAFTSAVKRAVLAVRSACASAQRRVAAVFFGSSSSSTTTTTTRSCSTPSLTTLPLPSRSRSLSSVAATLAPVPVAASASASASASATATTDANVVGRVTTPAATAAAIPSIGVRASVALTAPRAAAVLSNTTLPPAAVSSTSSTSARLAPRAARRAEPTRRAPPAPRAPLAPLAPPAAPAPPAPPRASTTAAAAATRVRPPRVTRFNFSPDQDETQAELVVFGPPHVFQSAGEYDLRMFQARRRASRIHVPISRARIAASADWESFLVRPNGVLQHTLESMSPNPIISPQDPVDPATQFCSCGQCPHGIAATQECTYLTIFWREQRFRRRAATSLASTAINRWHRACSTRPAFGRVRC